MERDRPTGSNPESNTQSALERLYGKWRRRIITACVCAMIATQFRDAGFPQVQADDPLPPTPGSIALSLSKDALIAPDLPAGGLVFPAATADNRPGYYDTSTFILGRSVVKTIAVHNGTPTELQTAEDQTKAGFEWWKQFDPHISFTFTPIVTATTSVNPMDLPQSDERFWISEALTNLGHPCTPETYFTCTRELANQLREENHTDWAVIVFVVDSTGHPDEFFADGEYCAWAYLGGPFAVTTTGACGLGKDNLKIVVAHEGGGHGYGAKDQYLAAKTPCNSKGGYLGVETQNSEQNCEINVSSIMKDPQSAFPDNAVDYFGLGQVGIMKQDGNKDINKVAGTFVFTPTQVITDTVNVTITGMIANDPWPPQPGKPAININSITTVTAVNPFDNQTFPVYPADGAFDDTLEPITVTLPISTPIVNLMVGGSLNEPITLPLWQNLPYKTDLPIVIKQ